MTKLEPEQIAKLLLIVGGLNWLATAYGMNSSTTPIPDGIHMLLQLAAGKASAINDERQRHLQMAVYVGVGVAALYEASNHFKNK